MASTVLVLAAGVALGWLGISAQQFLALALMVWVLALRTGQRQQDIEEIRRRERDEEDLNAKRRSRLRLSERERALLEELDARVWVDELVQKIYRKYSRRLSASVKGALDDLLASLDVPSVLDVRLTTFCLGRRAPHIRRVVATRLESPDDAQLDVHVQHLAAEVRVELAARLGGNWIGMTLPLRLSSISLDAVFRIKANLSEREPYVAVLDVSLLQKPAVFDFVLHAVVELSSGLPSIAEALKETVTSKLEDLMLWPRKLTFPLDEWQHPTSVAPRVAKGVLRVTVDRASDLPAADLDGYSDPFVRLEVVGSSSESSSSFQTAVISKSLRPVWDHSEAFLFQNEEELSLVFKIFDYDAYGDNDLLGTAVVPPEVLRDLLTNSSSTTSRGLWLQIASPKKQRDLQKLRTRDRAGPPRLRVELSYGDLVPLKQSFKALDVVLKSQASSDGGEQSAVEDAAEESKDVNNFDDFFHDDDDDDDAAEEEEDAEEKTVMMERGTEEPRPSLVAALDEEVAWQLLRYGQVTLRAGRVRKQSLAGLRAWRTRWLELQLALEYEPESPDPLVAATLVDCRDDLDASKKKKNAPVPVGELRLGEKSEVLGRALKKSFSLTATSASQFEIGNAKGKLWRVRCADGDDARQWTEAISRALSAVRADRETVAALLRRQHREDGGTSRGATVVVEIIEARGLVGAEDTNPFVVATVGPQTHATRAVRQTLAPRWNEYVELWAGAEEEPPSSHNNERPTKIFGGFELAEQELKIEVFDEDLARRRDQADLLGSVTLPLQELRRESDDPPDPRWFPLHPPRHLHERNDNGEIFLRVTLRRFEVAKLGPRHRVSQSARVLHAVAGFAKGVQGVAAEGVSSVKNSVASQARRNKLRAVAHAVSFAHKDSGSSPATTSPGGGHDDVGASRRHSARF